MYLAFLFSFAYYGIAKVNHLSYSWSDALVASIFIPLFVSDLPKLLVIKVLAGLHVLLVVTVGLGTIVGYLRRKLDSVQKAATDLRTRFEDKDLKEKYSILERQFDPSNPKSS